MPTVVNRAVNSSRSSHPLFPTSPCLLIATETNLPLCPRLGPESARTGPSGQLCRLQLLRKLPPQHRSNSSSSGSCNHISGREDGTVIASSRYSPSFQNNAGSEILSAAGGTSTTSTFGAPRSHVGCGGGTPPRYAICRAKKYTARKCAFGRQCSVLLPL